jgi:hypothetical protein
VLTDDVFVEKRLDLRRLGKLMGRGRRCLSFGTVVFQNGIAHRNALIADVGARVISG